MSHYSKPIDSRATTFPVAQKEKSNEGCCSSLVKRNILITALVVAVLGTLFSLFLLLNATQAISLSFMPQIGMIPASCLLAILAAATTTAGGVLAYYCCRRHNKEGQAAADGPKPQEEQVANEAPKSKEKIKSQESFRPANGEIPTPEVKAAVPPLPNSTTPSSSSPMPQGGNTSKGRYENIQKLPWFLQQIGNQLRFCATEQAYASFQADVQTTLSQLDQYGAGLSSGEQQALFEAYRKVNFPHLKPSPDTLTSFLENVRLFLLSDASFNNLNLDKFPKSREDKFFDPLVIKGYLSGRVTQLSACRCPIAWAWLEAQHLDAFLVSDRVDEGRLGDLLLFLFNLKAESAVLQSRINSLSTNAVNVLLPYLDMQLLAILEDKHVLSPSFQWSRLQKSYFVPLFSHENAQKRFEKLGIDWVNTWAEKLGSSLTYLPMSMFANARLRLEALDAPSLQNIFYYYLPGSRTNLDDSQLKAIENAKNKMIRLNPNKINALADKLKGEQLALLSAEQWQALDVQRIDRTEVKRLFELLWQLDSNKVMILKGHEIVRALGIKKTNVFLDLILPMHVPDEFLRDDALDLQILDASLLRSFFDYYFTRRGNLEPHEKKAIEEAMRRIRLLSNTKLNAIAGKLPGKQLALLSASQFSGLEVTQIDPVELLSTVTDLNYFKLGLTGPQILQAIGIKNTNYILKNVSLADLPDEFLKNATLALETLTQQDLSTLFYYYYFANAAFNGDLILEVSRKIRLLPPFKVNQIASKLDGKQLALLSEEQFRELAIAQVEGQQLITMFQRAAELSRNNASLSSEGILKALGIEKTNLIMQYVPAGDLPIAYWTDPQARVDLLNYPDGAFYFFLNSQTHLDSRQLIVVKSVMEKIRKVHVNNVNAIAASLPGSRLALLSAVQLADLDISLLPSDLLRNMLQWMQVYQTYSVGLSPQEAFIALGIDKVNQIMQKITNVRSYGLPDDFFKNVSLRLEDLSEGELNDIFYVPEDTRAANYGAIVTETKRLLSIVPRARERLQEKLWPNRKVLLPS